MEPARDAQKIIRLLTTAVLLLAVLVAFAVGAAAYSFTQYRDLRASVQRAAGTQLGSVDQLLQRATTLLGEVKERQDRLADVMEARSVQTKAEIQDLQARRKQLDPVAAGPMDKLEQMIRLNQLLADEQLLLLKHTAATQEALAESLQPPASDDRRGVGGSGK